MRSRRAVVVCALAALALAGCGGGGDSTDNPGAAPKAEYPTRAIELMAPAAPGGGWDITARQIQKSLKEGNLVSQAVEVYNVPGAAGTIGLAQLATKHRGDPHQLMVMGLVMVGGVVTNKSAVNLTQTTPIATLTAEQEVIVVPTASKYQTLKDLLDDVVRNPASVKFGGGSAGGTDHILVGLLAKAAGADPRAVTYVAYSGGGETKAALLSGDLAVGVSGQSEFKDLVQAGKLRVLAVSGAKGVDAGEGKPAQTIKEAGYDVELLNWRGIVAPPGISDAERAAIIELVDKLHSSAPWQATLKAQNWDDFYQSGDAAAAYFTSENTRISTVLADIGLASK